MAESIVKTIINPAIGTGQGKKGPWSQAMVELENGQSVRIFQPIAEGQTVESVQNGEYINWVPKKVTKPTQDNTEVLEALRKMYSKILTLEAAINKLLYVEEGPVDGAEPGPSQEVLYDENGNVIPF